LIECLYLLQNRNDSPAATLQQFFFRKLSIYFIRNVASVFSCHSGITIARRKKIWKISILLARNDRRFVIDDDDSPESLEASVASKDARWSRAI